MQLSASSEAALEAAMAVGIATESSAQEASSTDESAAGPLVKASPAAAPQGPQSAYEVSSLMGPSGPRRQDIVPAAPQGPQSTTLPNGVVARIAREPLGPLATASRSAPTGGHVTIPGKQVPPMLSRSESAPRRYSPGVRAAAATQVVTRTPTTTRGRAASRSAAEVVPEDSRPVASLKRPSPVRSVLTAP